MYETSASLRLNALEAEASLQVNFSSSGGVCPIISEIDGGDAGDNSQFQPINGNLDGGGA